MPKAAQRTGGGQHARSGAKVVAKKHKAPSPAPQRHQRPRSPSQLVTIAVNGGGMDLDEVETTFDDFEVEREWTDQIWTVQKPGDRSARNIGEEEDWNDDFDDRVGRVLAVCKQKWPQHMARGPPSVDEVTQALTDAGGHCGRATGELLPAVISSGVTIEGVKDGDQPVLPEFMVQKINDLGTQVRTTSNAHHN